MRIIGIDPSLTCTGVAVLDHVNVLQSLQSLTTSAPRTADGISGTHALDARAHRITSIANRLDDILDTHAAGGGPLLLVVETRDFQTDAPGHATDRAGLLFQLVITCRSYGATTVGVAPAALKVFATGNGRASKDDVKAAIEGTYQVPVANADEADAFTLAAMGAHAMGRPIRPDLPDYYTRAVNSVRWPKIATTPRGPDA